MGIRNYLIEGVSGTGKTSVCKELQRRGYYAINGEKFLEPPQKNATASSWLATKASTLSTCQMWCSCVKPSVGLPVSGLFDGVFVLEVDLDTLNRRLDERTENEWGGKQTERELIVRLHQTKEDIPKSGIIIDATAPIARVVDEIVRQSPSPQTTVMQHGCRKPI